MEMDGIKLRLDGFGLSQILRFDHSDDNLSGGNTCLLLKDWLPLGECFRNLSLRYFREDSWQQRPVCRFDRARPGEMRFLDLLWNPGEVVDTDSISLNLLDSR